jgi:rhodanese-related sulfurtransferase
MTHYKQITVILLATLFTALACTKKSGKISQMPPMEAMGMVRNDFGVLIDIREPDEQKDGTAVGAKFIPLSKIESDNDESKRLLNQFPKDKRILILGSDEGATASSSTRAAEKFASNGYDVGLIGGYQDWVKAGLPTEKKP